MYQLNWFTGHVRSRVKKKLDDHTLKVNVQNEITVMNAVISFYLHVSPTELSDEDFVIKYRQVQYCLDLEEKRMQKQIHGD